MWEFLSLKDEIFGLDINDLSIKIIKLEKKRGGFVLSSSNKMKMEPGIMQEGIIKDEIALSKTIKYACATSKGKKIKTKYVAVSVPEEKSFLQVIKMPKMTEEELMLAVPFEAENYIPMPIGEVYLDFQVIPGPKDFDRDYLEVLIVATPKKIVDSYISCLKKSGLVPIIFETESEAIARALIKKENNSLLSIIIDFGANNTNLVVFAGNSVRFTSSVPVSSGMLTEAISKSLKISANEAEELKIEYGLEDFNNIKKLGKRRQHREILAERARQIMVPILEDFAARIRKYLDFYIDHSPCDNSTELGKTEKIILCGGGADLKGLSEFMSKHLKIPTEVGNPLLSILEKKSNNAIKKDASSFTTAIGLALRQPEC